MDDCCGEFYLHPPADHVFRYAWAAKRLSGYTGMVFDIGCGSGYGCLILGKSGLKVVGIDRSSKAVDICDARGVLAYCYSFGAKSDRFQSPYAAVLMEVIEHNAHGMGILRHLCENADRVLFSVPYMEKPGNNDYHKLFSLSEESFSWMKPKPQFFRPAEAPDSLLVEWLRDAVAVSDHPPDSEQPKPADTKERVWRSGWHAI